MWERRALNPLVGLFTAALLSARAAGAADLAWTLLGLDTLSVRSIALDPVNPGTIWAAGNAGIPLQSGADTGRLFRSTDAGANWARVDFGVSTTFVDVVAAAPGASAVYLGVSGFGLRRSGDGGRTWQDVSPERNGYVEAIAIDPNDAAMVYAGLFAYGCEQPCLYKSLNRGDRWMPLDASPPYLDVTALATDPRLPGTLYVGTYGYGAFKTSDGGATLQPINEGLKDAFVYALAVDPRDSRVVFAGGGGLTGLVSSSLDGGATWRGSALGSGATYAIVIDPRTNPSTVYVGGDAGVFRSRDRGGHWDAVGAGLLSKVSALAISNADPPVLYAGTWDRGVFALTLETVPKAGAGLHSWIVPSSARAPGAGGAFYTTDLAIANPGGVDATLTIQFLGHDGDGTAGPVSTRMLGAGRAVTYADVLGSLFGLESGYGALQVSSDSAALRITAVSSTPSSNGRGRVGQGVPAFDSTRLATPGSPAVLVGLRDDQSARTNLFLASASAFPVTVELTLFGADGAVLGVAARALPPAGMTQVSSVVSALGGPVASDAYLVVSVATAGGAVAAYASVTDNGTNDPRTIVP